MKSGKLYVPWSGFASETDPYQGVPPEYIRGNFMRNVGIWIFDNMELLDLAGPYEVFSIRIDEEEESLFNVFTISWNGEAINTVNGLKVFPDHSFRDHPHMDILILPGGRGTRKEVYNENVLNWVSACHKESEITLSVCTGSFILGRLGLLDGLECTTHHSVRELFREIAPKAEIVTGRRFVDNGKILTAAGVSAGIDLSLHVVARLHGQDEADSRAVYMEYGNWESKDI